MSTRRGHRKSRHGCAECKKRHIKCDESRPACANCSITKRACSFTSTTARIPARSFNPGTSTISIVSPPSSWSSVQTSPSARSNTVSPQSLYEHEVASLLNAIDVPPANLAQLELLHHFINGNLDLPIVAAGSNKVTPSKFVAEAVSCDYLMNEILAFSARHLAIQRADRSSYYLRQAKQLQTHALASFTREHVEPTERNCLGVLFFAWMLGTHLLSDVAALDEQHNTLEEFLHYIRLHRGVLIVSTTAWKFLMKTEHRHMFEEGSVRAGNFGDGDHTAAVRLLIRDSLGMDEVQKQGSDEALARIQWIFSFYERNGLDEARNECFMFVFSWPLLLTSEFVGLLQKKRPEALLTLAYFAVVLHWCQNNWIFGQVGSRLLKSIVSVLGQGWERWLQFPIETIEKRS